MKILSPYSSTIKYVLDKVAEYSDWVSRFVKEQDLNERRAYDAVTRSTS